jgi:hypothetical protein
MATNPAAFTGPGQVWQPSDNGLLIANSDPWDASGSAVLTAGTLYLSKLTARALLLLSTLWFGLQAAGAGASTGSFAGVYSSAGVLLSGSADIAAQLTGAAGGFSVPLTSPQQIPAGQFVWAAVLANLATTQPTLAKGIGGAGGGAITDINLTAAAFRFATNGTGLVALPGSITPAANASTPSDFWAGGS